MTKAAEIIAKEIMERGPISFARFTELALYCPVYGFYEKEADTIGARGDYFTSVSVGSLFGELLAFQFANWLSSPDAGDGPVQIVEAGAHSGQLARDILAWLQRRKPALFERLEYWSVEPSPVRQEWQRRTLEDFAGKVRWAESMSRVRPEPDNSGPSRVRRLHGIIFSNEMLDALPVHRMGWDVSRKAWFEWGVEVRNGRFVWTRLNNGTAAGLMGDGCWESWPTSSRFGAVAAVLPNGFTTEVCPAASEWWREAAESIAWGKLVTLDYGLAAAEEFLSPERADGTVRGYRQHHLNTDVLADPGEQDITAQVNFSAIQAVGEISGLETDGLLTQEQFLTKIASRTWEQPGSFDEWTPQRTREFKTLTHPEHLGRPFRVLVQSRTSGAG